ncbi:MAG: hypothetical protein GY943_38420 [Chloroflexi bacterium]|nr:hypothetical protein [Chloroflexota bacterium]
MEKIIRLISGIILVLVGFMIPIYTAGSFVGLFDDRFWVGVFVVSLSFLFTGGALFMSAIIVGSAYPGMLENSNEFGRKIHHQTIELLFWLGCAGTKSVWRINEEKVARGNIGLWHGFFSPITLGLSLVSNRIQLYESNNDGYGYNIGFAFGIYLAHKAIALFM